MHEAEVEPIPETLLNVQRDLMHALAALKAASRTLATLGYVAEAASAGALAFELDTLLLSVRLERSALLMPGAVRG